MCRREVGNHIHNFSGRAFFARDDPRHLGDLMNVRLGGMQIGMHLGCDANAAMFDPPATSIPGFGLGAVRMG
ncbi:MAG: hypothetical protein ACRDHZ_26025, partial [Ktedonobacteraceae bacterium]